ncbi:dehydrogenase/reductase SDR family member on chromosome X-like [Triplophysa rosa]|uniref:dehydrogenase/reductase SDR family member on chromosome X-like n=1 Tax=Triplophysa rosa TaxID=992332 RepID=UPI0025461C09|nr:dehydrogenase/reductase SDR family member on chromosome X-like [Triplophysa rosa]
MGIICASGFDSVGSSLACVLKALRIRSHLSSLGKFPLKAFRPKLWIRWRCQGDPASRNEEEALSAVKKICEENSEAQVDFEFLDVSSLRSVREFVRRFKDRGRPLHVLINNAGAMLLPEGRPVDGFETHFATNYLGHFLLTRLLLETLVHSGKDESYSRILNISSSAHYAADLRLHDLQNASHVEVMRLESSGAPVTVSAVDAGAVNTGLYSHLRCVARYAHKLTARFFFKTPADGAATAVYSAVSPHLERVSGCYLHEGRCVRSSPNSSDKDLHTRLWQNTCDLLNLQHSLELHSHIRRELK